MASPEVWGARLWRILHGLADLSDRRDIFPLWNTFLKYTAHVIPCQKCQHHMQEYWSHRQFLPKGWNQLTGEQTREVIRQLLYAFHNDVNRRLGKPVHPPLPALAAGAIANAAAWDRQATLRDVQRLFDELREEWSAAHLEWKRSGALLISLVAGGSQT